MMKSDFGTHRGDVIEVLLGPDTQINASGLHSSLQPGRDFGELDLVGQEVLRLKGSVVLGQSRDQFPENFGSEYLSGRVSAANPGPANPNSRAMIAIMRFRFLKPWVFLQIL
jgi:hypothetical protein